MATYSVQINADVSPVYERYYLLESPPIWWHTLASQMDKEGGDRGGSRYQTSHHRLESVGIPKLQDTYIIGTGSRTGIPFTVTGTWKDDWISTWSGKYGLEMPDATDGTTWTAQQTNLAAFDEHRLIVITRGQSDLNTSRTPSNFYATLELNYQDVRGSYRIVLKSGAPITLEYLPVGSQIWKQVDALKDFPNFDTYINTQKDHRVDIYIKPDFRRGLLIVEVGHNHILRHSAPKASTSSYGQVYGDLPFNYSIRYSGKNGTTSLEVLPIRYQPLAPVKNPIKGIPSANIGSAQLHTNHLSEDDSRYQTTVGSITNNANGIGWSATISAPDAGDGLGSKSPPTLTDAIVYIPPVFSKPIDFNGFHDKIRWLQCELEEVWDDINRFGYMQGQLVFQNYYGTYNDWFGHLALSMYGTNGIYSDQIFTGIVGTEPGVSYHHADPVRIGFAPFKDKTYMLEQAVGQELILDGLSVYSAVRLLLMCGGVHPDFMAYIPDHGFPPYPNIWNVPILAKGTGNNAKWRIDPQTSILQAILELVKDLGQTDLGLFPPYTTTVTPFYFFQDVYGQFHFEPFNPGFQNSIGTYSTKDPTGLGQIESIEVTNSISNLRTEVFVQGQDWNTNEFTQASQPLRGNIQQVGFRKIAIERNARYLGELSSYVALKNLARVSSLPEQFAKITVPWHPFVHAGQVVGINDPSLFKGTRYFLIIRQNATLGYTNLNQDANSPQLGLCRTKLTCRSIASDLVF